MVLTSLCLATVAQYGDSRYRVTEDGELLDDDDDDERPKKGGNIDYTKYFNGAASSSSAASIGILGAPNDASVKDDSAGFIEPIDFTSFAANNFGGLDTAGAGSAQLFAPPGASVQFASPAANLGFSNLETSATNTNHSIGFINPNINFQSMFDAAGSASEVGFRPQDFLPQDNRGGDTKDNPYGLFFTPPFAALKDDADKDYHHQRKEIVTSQSVTSDKKRPSLSKPITKDYDDSDDDFPLDEYDGIDTHDTSPKKYTSKPIKNEKPPYRPTYGSLYKASESRPNKPSPTSAYGYGSPFEYSGDDSTENAGYTTEPKQVSAPPHLGKSSHTSYAKQIPLYHKAYASGSYGDGVTYPPAKNFRHKVKPLHKSSSKTVYSKKTVPSSKKYPGHGDSNPYHDYSLEDDFKPSPSDPYMDAVEKPFSDSSSHDSPDPTTLDDLYKLPQTDYATVIKKKEKHEQDASETKKKCTKINKKINSKDVGHRFRRQQMTCFVCKDPKTGGNYEECSYQSEPNAKEYFKGSAESFSSETSLQPVLVSLRTKRGLKQLLKKHDAEYADTVRKVRQHEEEHGDDSEDHGGGGGGEDDSGSYYGPDGDNYRFGPEYFTEDGLEEEGEESKTEQSSPRAESDEQCKKVKKDGLICMVCSNPKTSGSYEQCSYASDPQSNKYEYSKSSRYGSPSPTNSRHKRYIDEITEKKKNRKNSFKRKYRQDDSIEDLQNRGDFKYGKLKRKKVGRGGYVLPEISGSLLEAEATKTDKRGGVGLDPFLYGSPDKSDENANTNSSSEDSAETSATSVEDDDLDGNYDDYFYRLFPELAPKGDKADEESDEEKDEEPSSVEAEDDDEEDFSQYFDSEQDEEVAGDEGEESDESDGEEDAEGEEETKQSKKKVNPVDDSTDYFDVAENKKQIEKVLGEFSQKDRKNCKKVMRDKMTCFQCTDKKGMQREECMFVAASAPKSKHLAYHEVKEFRMAPKGNKDKRKSAKGNGDENLSKTGPATFESQDNLKVIDPKIEGSSKEVESSKRKRKTDHKSLAKPTDVPVAVVTDNLSQSAEMYDILKTNPKFKQASENADHTLKVLSRKKRLPESEPPNDQERYGENSDSQVSENRPSEDAEGNKPVRKNYNSIPPEPGPFEVPEGPEGAYSDETVPVFDKVLKITLPKYMLTKSEDEEEFDEVVASG